MNAPLTTRPTATASLDAATLVQGDTLLNQQPGDVSNGFGPLLQQAVGQLGENAGPPVISQEGMDALSRQLQGLPQGGKLLPLLQEVLDAAAAEGVDPRTVFKDIAVKLKQLSLDTDLDPTQAIATAIQQFVDDNPKLAASLGSQLTGPADKGLLRDVSAQTPAAPAGEPLVHPRAGTQSSTLPVAAAHAANSAVNPQNTPDTSQQRPLAGLDSLAAELLPITPEQRKAVLGEAISLFKRLASGNSKASATSEGLSRSDSVLTALTSATTLTPPAATAAHPASASAVPTLSLNAPFNQAGWDRALGERIQWLVGKGIQNANIKLNPAHLGPMEVRIQIQHDQASVQFTSAHGVVRDALEAALPRLRDMFDSSGVQLADVDVSGQSFAEQQAAANGQGGGGDGGRGVGFEPREDAEITLETPVYFSPDSGRLDLFA